MSFKGTVDINCPNGCESDQADVWSFVRGDSDPALREALLAGELNLIVCLQCGAAFFPESTIVYHDPAAELLAFIFPESYRKEEARWRKKMQEDFEQMRSVLDKQGGGYGEPILFFGMEAFRGLLQEEDDLEDEVQIAELLCKQLKIGTVPVERAFVRERHLPRLLPVAGKFSRQSAIEGTRSLLEANDRLEGYRRWQDVLKKESVELPVKPAGKR